MRTRLRTIPGWIALGLFLTCLQTFAQENKAGPVIQVQVNYTGTGTVDEKHKIFVALWDSPDFTQGGVMPVSLQSTDSKNGTLTFSNVQSNPAYLSAVYDPTGGWDGASGPPTSGASLGLCSKTPGQPEAVKAAPGETVKVTLAFDDKAKMP